MTAVETTAIRQVRQLFDKHDKYVNRNRHDFMLFSMMRSQRKRRPTQSCGLSMSVVSAAVADLNLLPASSIVTQSIRMAELMLSACSIAICMASVAPRTAATETKPSSTVASTAPESSADDLGGSSFCVVFSLTLLAASPPETSWGSAVAAIEPRRWWRRMRRILRVCTVLRPSNGRFSYFATHPVLVVKVLREHFNEVILAIAPIILLPFRAFAA